MRTQGPRLAHRLLTLAALALLIGLGVWQLKRLAWKEGLIAEIETRAKGEPITPARGDRRWPRRARIQAITACSVEGRFDNAKELYLYARRPRAGRLARHRAAQRPDEGDVVLIDRGFVPDALRDPSYPRSRRDWTAWSPSPASCVSRKPKALFTPDNEVGGQSLVLARPPRHDVFHVPRGRRRSRPFFLEAEKSDVPGGWPEGGQTRLELPNNHLQYAITWFLLAGAVVIIYLVYVRSAYRRRMP